MKIKEVQKMFESVSDAADVNLHTCHLPGAPGGGSGGGAYHCGCCRLL